jgi:organic hydroperoxide reductase OsmC/OhrA
MKGYHFYSLRVNWTGNKGDGTADYRSYDRSYIISGEDKPEIEGSSVHVFMGDHTRYNPEEMMVASLSACHMLWYLHICADNGIVVTDYSDSPVGTLFEQEDGSGRFTEVNLSPVVTVSESWMVEKAGELHEVAHRYCFIANSVNFPVNIQPKISPIEKVQENQPTL